MKPLRETYEWEPNEKRRHPESRTPLARVGNTRERARQHWPDSKIGEGTSQSGKQMKADKRRETSGAPDATGHRQPDWETNEEKPKKGIWRGAPEARVGDTGTRTQVKKNIQIAGHSYPSFEIHQHLH